MLQFAFLSRVSVSRGEKFLAHFVIRETKQDRVPARSAIRSTPMLFSGNGRVSSYRVSPFAGHQFGLTKRIEHLGIAEESGTTKVD